MTNITPEERQRILRERRQAKMAKGQASERLNTILSQGSSYKVEETLPLDKPQSSSSAVHASIPTADRDPEIQDISSVSTPEPDMDAIFQSVFGQANPAQSGASEDPFSEMMKNLLQGTGGPTPGPNSPLGEGETISLSPEQKYAEEMAVYSEYKHKAWRMSLLAVRYTVVTLMFAYYYVAATGFAASSHADVRILGVDNRGRDFFRLFTALEILFTSTYYIIGTRNNWFAEASLKGLISKGLSMGLMVLPQLQQFKPIVEKALAYYTLLGMVVGDLSLVIVLFGLFSKA